MLDSDAYLVRPAVAADAATLVAQTEALAAFHGKPGAASVTVADILRDGFGERPLIWFWLAEECATGRTVGYIQLCQGYAAWLGRPTLVVSNLYVEEATRGSGLGRRLMATAAAYARGLGVERMELHVAERNPARRFYEAIGYKVMPDHRCRIERAPLERLAASP